MPKDKELTSLGEFSVGGEELPQPKWIAPAVREVTFGLVDDVPEYEYAELLPAIPASEGYFPSMGPEGVISGVPHRALTTADVVGGITGEIAGEFVFGGLGVVIGAAIRPAIKTAGRTLQRATKQSVRAPSFTTSNGHRVWMGKNKNGDTIYKIMSPDGRGRISGVSGPQAPNGFIDIGTIFVEREARGGKLGKNYKHELYNALLETAQKQGLEGLSSARVTRTSPITDRFWADYGEMSIKGIGNYSHLEYDLLTQKTIPPMRPNDFNIVPAGKNPILEGNRLMEEGAQGVVPLRKLMGEERYAPIRPGQGDRIDAWAVLDDSNLVNVPEPNAEGLTNVKVKRPKSRGASFTTDPPIDTYELPNVEELYNNYVDPNTNKMKDNDRWSFVYTDDDPRIDPASWGVAYDYDGYVESGGADFKAIIEPVADPTHGDKDIGYLRLTLADGTIENFSSLNDAYEWMKKTKKLSQ